MKKIIITMFALTLGVGAFAKTLDTLVAEMPKGWSSNVELNARTEYVKANKDDFVRELKAYMVLEIAKKPMGSLSDKDQEIRRAFAPAYSLYGREIGVPEIVGLRISPQRYFDIYGVEGYEKIKSDNWTLDGVALSNTEIIILSVKAKDAEYIINSDIKQWSKHTLSISVADVSKLLIGYSDLQKAKNFCRKYQGAMLVKGISESSEDFKKMRAIEDYLNRGILFK